MSTERAAALVLILIAVSLVTRMTGPLLTGGMELGPRATRVIALLPAALLAALAATGAFARDTSLTVDARTGGIAVAVLLALRRPNILVVIFGAAAATAVLRLAGL